MTNNIRTAGSAEICEGEYGSIAISGSCRILGNITFDELKCSGSCYAAGDIKGGRASVSGAFRVDGAVHADTLKASGSASVGGDITGGDIGVSGAISCAGKVKCEKLVLSGTAKIAGDCEAETVNAHSFTIGGLLNAGTVDIELPGGAESSVPEIGCEKLTVKYARGFLLSKGFRSRLYGSLKVGSIEADTVDIVGVTADRIACTNAVIGSGCRIGTVEYTGTITVKDGAEIKEQRKV